MMTRGIAFRLAIFTALVATMAACALFVGIDEIVYRAVDAGDEADGATEDGRIGGDGSSAGPHRDASFVEAGAVSDGASDSASDDGSDDGSDAYPAPSCYHSSECDTGCCCQGDNPQECWSRSSCTIDGLGACLL
jgi:hypothetical protein